MKVLNRLTTFVWCPTEINLSFKTSSPTFVVFFCLWNDVKKVLRIEPFVEIWDKEKKEWVKSKS